MTTPVIIATCRTARDARLAVILCGALVACTAWQPDLGPAMANGCIMADSDPKAEISFRTDVYTNIIMPMCLPCHDPKTAAAVGFTNGGLDLTSLAGLRAGGKSANASIVISGDPCRSTLYKKIVGAGQRGSRMPLGDDPLTAVQVRVIHDWIAEGARDN